jgi:hypothetical protein
MLMMIGLLLYFAHVERGLGRALITEGVVLAVVRARLPGHQ